MKKLRRMVSLEKVNRTIYLKVEYPALMNGIRMIKRDAKHQVIVSGEALGSGQDHLEPVLTEAQENMEGIGKDEEYFKDTILTADMAYHSGENIKRCEEI